jgi:hypothetical protein
MIKHTDDYQEAKIIIKNSVNDEFNQKLNKAAKLRALFTSVVGVSAVVATGIVSQDPVITGAMVPVCGMISLPFMLPFFAQKATKKSVESGKYFDDKSQSDIINTANEYADQYNEWEAKRSK